MREIAVLVLAMACSLLPACSGGTKSPAELSSEDAAPEENESELVAPDKTPSPELVMEVINTVLN